MRIPTSEELNEVEVYCFDPSFEGSRRLDQISKDTGYTRFQLEEAAWKHRNRRIERERKEGRIA